MSFRMLLAGIAAGSTLVAQQSAQQTNAWTIDANGHRVEGPLYATIESTKGSQHVETQRSINGRLVPIQSAEDRVLREDAQGKVVERIIRRYDANGNLGLPIKFVIEEKKKPDGSTSILSTGYESDINGNLRLFQRSATEIRKGATTETSTTIEAATLNGAMQVVGRTMSVERPTGPGSSQVEFSAYHRDVSGNFTPFAQEVKQITKNGAEETTDDVHYEMGIDGKMTLTSRAIEHVRTSPDGSQLSETDVYSLFSVGRTGDATADKPRLQEQIRRQRTPGPGGVVVETSSVRARLPNDQSRFGPYEQGSQTTYTSIDASGREVKTSTSVLGRRDPNGNIVAEEGQSSQTVTTKK